MILGNVRFRSVTTLIFIAWHLAVATNCAPSVKVISERKPEQDYTVRELQVTGRPIIRKHDLYPSLRIEEFNEPRTDGPFYIQSTIVDEVLLDKLDSSKSYRFHLFTTDQVLREDHHSHHAILSRIEDRGTVIVDASICHVHHCKMEFGPAANQYWSLRSSREERELEVFHNHGYAFPSCCSGGMYHWYAWRCPQCAKKVDAFKSKYDP